MTGLGYEHANFLSKLTFWFVNPLIRLGSRREIDEDTASAFLPRSENAEVLYNGFAAGLGTKDKVDTEKKVWWSFYRLYRWMFLKHFVLASLESGSRIAQPLFLRMLLDWFVAESEGRDDSSMGWLWASMMACVSYLYVLIHHQTFWCGMRMGMRMRCQVIAAIHHKVLRLNGRALADVTSGKIINLASNDVRRFDEAGTFAVFLFVGPLELIAVLVLVGIRLGFLAAVAGVASQLMLIPLQSVLARYIGKLRASTAKETDERVRLTGEAISGITSFKMLTWEKPLFDEILKVRQREQSFIRKMNMIRAMNMALTFAITPLVSFTTFVVARYTMDIEDFTVGNIFYAVSLLALPKLTMCEFFVHAVEAVSEVRVSVRRIAEFLSVEEPGSWRKQVAASRYGENDEDAAEDNKDTVCDMSHADFQWSSGPISGFSLKDISLSVKRQELIGVCGEIASGKSSLLSSLIGEMEWSSKKDGRIHLNAKNISYCSQKPWIISGTIQENVLFGSEYEEGWYEQVLEACCLNEDIANFPDGDDTVIGERGVNLSGGQKARLALARAAYKKAELNLLDDPLSALDSKVGASVFSNCFGENGVISACGGATILVTHQKQYLPECDHIIVLRNGMIAAEGSYQTLAQQSVPEVLMTSEDRLKVSRNVARDKKAYSKQTSTFWRNFVSKKHVTSLDTSTSMKRGGVEASFKFSKSGKLGPKEDQETGSVSWGVYKDLVLEFGLMRAIIVIGCLFAGQAIYIFGDYWLASWAAADDDSKIKSYWVWVYSIFVSTIIIISIFRSQLFFASCLKATNSIHRSALKRVLQAPLSFFHTNASGVVLNRFSKDLGTVDEQLPKVSFDAAQAFMMVFGALILLCVVIPVILPIFVPLILIFMYVQRRYLLTSREVKRFEAVSRSPLYQQLSNVLRGLVVIRVYDAEETFKTNFLSLLTENIGWWYSWLCSARWIGFRLDIMVSIIITAAPLLMVGLRSKFGDDNAKLVGLALSQCLYLAGLLQWMVRQTAEVENNMTSTERLFAYTGLEQEPATLDNGGTPPPPNWPSAGTIEYSHVYTAYRKGLPPVLKDLSFVVQSGTTCGIVGRTGSGKSSLMLSLFRLIPNIDGTVYIDGIDTSKIALDALRKEIAIIPQDPVLFSGTLRANLDPWSQYSDAALWEALDKAKLKEQISSMSDKGLHVNLQECGENFSAGQRQLLCLARVLLTDSRILALDEATANVDSKTDLEIQNAVHRACAEGAIKRTLLVIAHRLDTIMNCDKVLVLSQGELVEEGSPVELVSKQDGHFHAMAKSSKLL
ncbi:hypothetical protein M9435_006360 [Picochlorum sp. BPE23]|nr:hypothetical protein M9435_006360 [Picochlorum sp. BPE23]